MTNIEHQLQNMTIAFGISTIVLAAIFILLAHYISGCRNYKKRAESAEENLIVAENVNQYLKRQILNAKDSCDELSQRITQAENDLKIVSAKVNDRNSKIGELQNSLSKLSGEKQREVGLLVEENLRLSNYVIAANKRYRLAGYAYDKLKQELHRYRNLKGIENLS